MPNILPQFFIAIAAIVATACMPQTTDATAAVDSTPPHLLWAQRLVAELAPDRNAYAWSPTFVVWSEDNDGPARNRSVCSSFVTHDLERAYGFGRPEILKRFGTSNPQAKDYAATILAERGFSRVSRLADARPGDIIAIRYPAGSHPTGHVVILAGRVRARASTQPIVAGTAQFEADVIDSSRSFHGLHDTRYLAKDRHAGGVGEGTMRLYVAADGTISGYAWSTRRVSKYYGNGEREMVVGRFEQHFAGLPASPIASGTTDAVGDQPI